MPLLLGDRAALRYRGVHCMIQHGRCTGRVATSEAALDDRLQRMRKAENEKSREEGVREKTERASKREGGGGGGGVPPARRVARPGG